MAKSTYRIDECFRLVVAKIEELLVASSRGFWKTVVSSEEITPQEGNQSVPRLTLVSVSTMLSIEACRYSLDLEARMRRVPSADWQGPVRRARSKHDFDCGANSVRHNRVKRTSTYTARMSAYIDVLFRESCGIPGVPQLWM
jgi:hypothetical protein